MSEDELIRQLRIAAEAFSPAGQAAETILALRAEVEALRGHFAPLIEAFDAHKVANERTNAAIPDITTATRAEYAVYDERYRISEEAKRDWHKAIFDIITDEDFRAALSTTEAK